MNYPILAAGSIVFVAFMAHTVIGNRETLSTRPASLANKPTKQSAIVERNWVQSFCTFQLVTVDLFVLSLLLFALGATDIVPAKREVALGMAIFFCLWSVAWLVQLLVLRRCLKDYFVLSQWIFWFVCAGLLFWGAQAL